jgi:hypothetical protein
VAQKPDGKAAKTERVSFTRPAAERIGRVVRIVEAGNRDSGPLTFDRPLAAQGSPIKSATFTGAWSIGAAKLVTWKYVTGTAIAYNDLIDLPNASSRNCIVGKEGTAWRLINWQWQIAHAATQAELTTTTLKFYTLPVGAVSTSSTVTFNISVASCTTAS